MPHDTFQYGIVPNDEMETWWREEELAILKFSVVATKKNVFPSHNFAIFRMSLFG